MVTKIVVLAIYFSILLLIGWLASRKVKGMQDYYIGGKNVGYWAATFSARATGESAWLLLGLTGMGAMAGISVYWVVVGEVLGVAGSWFLMAKKFKTQTDQFGSITIPDFLEDHFKTGKQTIRKVAAIALSLFVVIFVSSQIDATGKAFESLLNVNYYTGAIIGFVIVIAYSYLGGILAAVWSDFFQGILMLLGLVVLPIVAFQSVGSIDEVSIGLSNIDPNLLSLFGDTSDPWIAVATILGFAMIGLGFLGSPQIYVRFMSMKSPDEIDKGKWIAIAFTIITDSAAVTIGLLGRYLYTKFGQDPEMVLGTAAENVIIVMMDNLLPLTLVAVYIAVILSAIMSTIDSLIIVASSAITRDLYQKVMNPNIEIEQLTKLSKMVTLVLACLALVLAMTVAVLSPERTIFWFIIFGWSGIAATFCPVIILSLFWKGYTEKGAISSMVVGFLCIPFFKFVVQPIDGIGVYFEKLDVLFPSFILSMLVGYIVSKFNLSKS
jgi:sodium/proline symporter